MSLEEMDDAAARIHDTIQGCINDGLLADGMLTDWYLVGSYIGSDGDPGSIFINPESSRTPGSLALVNIARIKLEEEIRAWLWEDEE